MAEHQGQGSHHPPKWLTHSWNMGYHVGHAVQSFQLLHSVNEKGWGQVSTLLHTMWAGRPTTIGNQQSLPWCHPHRWFVFLYPCEEDLCQRKWYAGFLKSKSKILPAKAQRTCIHYHVPTSSQICLTSLGSLTPAWYWQSWTHIT